MRLLRPAAATPGVIRFRLHPATELAIDATLRWAIPHLAHTSLLGKLVIVRENKIRIRS